MDNIDKTVFPITICKDDFNTIQNSPLVLNIEENDEVKREDIPGDIPEDNTSTNIGDDVYVDCGVDRCCKKCTTSEVMSKPGEEQPPGTDIDELMSVLITVNDVDANYY